MNRRQWLATSALSSVAGRLSIAESEFDPSEETFVISVFHTTDLHGQILPAQTYDGVLDVGGFGRCLSQIREWRQGHPNHLTLDIGDLYQGTQVSIESEGQLMVKLLNAAGFDGWVAGNHEFDWGESSFQAAVANSEMPVLSANLEVDGFPTGHPHHVGGPYANLVPTMLKEVAGFKIGIFGLTTPGLPYWLASNQLGSVVALDPLEQSRRAIESLKDQGAHCIIAAGHMGLRRGDGDDFANQVNRVLLACPEIDVYLAGHTHRDRPSTLIGRTLFTQAGYFGIWTGKVDLTFSKADKRLVRRDARTERMDASIEIDPLVMEIAGTALEQSRDTLSTVVGRLEIELETGTNQGNGPDTQALIATGITWALKKRGRPIDGVLHGAFTRDPIPTGAMTIADVWKIIPYENRIVTATLTGEQLYAILKEAFLASDRNRLVGFEVQTKGDREDGTIEVVSIQRTRGRPISPLSRFRIAFNSYDAQSGGRRLPLLREILLRPSSETLYHDIETRVALTDYFLDTKVVSL